jgi:hypothetical protein
VGWFRLNSIDEISEFMGWNAARIIDWIVYQEFPAAKVDNIWMARKKDVRRWMKTNSIKKGPGPHFVDHIPIPKRQTITRRRW